jgi:hypothetical protein
MPPVILADCILIIHTLFVAVVVISVPLIAFGGFYNWQWVKNPWFRFTHLFMIGFVALESLAGTVCPLTSIENRLRNSANQKGYGNHDFIASWLDRLLFYHFPSWVFTMIYVSFALLVASLFYFVPIKRKNKSAL